MSISSTAPPPRHAKSAKTPVVPPPPREFQVGDEVAVLDNKKGGRVVAVFPLHDRTEPVSLVVYAAHGPSFRYVGIESDECTLLAPARFRDRYEIIDWRLFDQALGITIDPLDSDHRRPPITVDEMRAEQRRLILAMELSHRAADLIRQPIEEGNGHGWQWADNYLGERAVALFQHAERQIGDLLSSSFSAITIAENAAALRAGGAS